MHELLDPDQITLDDSLFDLVDKSIEEDLKSGDVTTKACLRNETQLYARLILKESGTIAGLPLFVYAFKHFDPSLDVACFVEEGSHHKAGTVIATLSGPAYGIISSERTALNILQHTSGIATRTSQYCRLVNHFNCKIVDTRRTLPGLRQLEQYAIKCGGGVPHRSTLDDRFIIKRHHIALIGRTHPEPIKEAINRCRSFNPNLRVEIEISDFQSLEIALNEKVDLVYLDRMHPDLTLQCIKAANQAKVPAYFESASMITLNTIRTYAEMKPDGIVIQDLAHAPPLEIRLYKSQ